MSTTVENFLNLSEDKWILIKEFTDSNKKLQKDLELTVEQLRLEKELREQLQIENTAFQTELLTLRGNLGQLTDENRTQDIRIKELETEIECLKQTVDYQNDTSATVRKEMEELQGKYYSLLRGFDHVVDVVKEADDARKQPIINTARQNLLACVQSVRAKAKRSRNIFENISDTEDCIMVEPSTSKWYFFLLIIKNLIRLDCMVGMSAHVIPTNIKLGRDFSNF